MFVQTILGRTLALSLSLALSQLALPAAHAAGAPPGGHLVGARAVAERLVERARSREERVRLFQAALATPEARREARARGLAPERLRAAVPHLSDQELKDLAERASRAREVTAGHGGGDGLAVLGLLLLLAGLAVLVAVSYDDGWYDDGCYCY